MIILLLLIAFFLYTLYRRRKYVKAHPDNPTIPLRTILKNRRKHRGKYYSKWWFNYRKYLKSEHWKQFRLHEIELAHHKCQKCGIHSKHLDVHHLTYKRLGHERDSDVIVVCHNCHQKIHHRKF